MDGFITQLGVLMILVLVIGFLFSRLKLAMILAYITAGFAANYLFVFLNVPADHTLTHVFPEMGILLLLFSAGMEMDFSRLKKRLRHVLSIAAVQIIGTIGIGAGLAVWLLNVTSTATAIYFGLCLTFSSTVIVVQWLNGRRQLDSIHGMILLGVLILQDLAAIIAITLLGSMSSGNIGYDLLNVGWKLAVVALTVLFLGKYVLKWLFQQAARSRNLFFVTTFAWCFGVIGCCHLLDFSPELGAFLAGIAIANVKSYQLEIADKVEPLRELGLILFFTTLGAGLKVTSSIVSSLVPIAAILGMTWFGTLLLMGITGRLCGFRRHTIFFIAILPTQISEFSLVMATLSLKAGLFDETIFAVIMWSAILSILFYSIWSPHFEGLFQRFQTQLAWLERKMPSAADAADIDWSGHAVVLGYGVIGRAAVDVLNSKEEVVLVDIDPEVERLAASREGVNFIFGDMNDPDVWIEAGLKRCRIVISTVWGNQLAEIELADWLNEQNPDAVFIAVAENDAQAQNLRAHGISNVLVPDKITARAIESLLNSESTPTHV